MRQLVYGGTGLAAPKPGLRETGFAAPKPGLRMDRPGLGHEKQAGRKGGKGAKKQLWKCWAADVFLDISSLAILLWCMFRLSGSTYNPFIYFRF